MRGSRDARNALANTVASKVEGPAIFEDEIADTVSDKPKKQPKTRAGASLVREHLARAVDPDPRSRVRWERKMVMRQVARGTNPFSREPRLERIARTERQLTSRSPWLATSTKKLVKLAHQIQGKTVADALVQMRFSKKKMANEVRYQLELARDQAVVERGMGLGSSAKKDGESDEAGAAGEGGKKETIEIQTKDGKWVKIDDPTRMYVAEAWVNRGPWRGKEVDYRARGRTYIKQKPTTSKHIHLFFRFISPWLCPVLTGCSRHHGRPQGGKDADPRGRRARGQEVPPGPLGAPPRPPRHRPEAVVLVVDAPSGDGLGPVYIQCMIDGRRSSSLKLNPTPANLANCISNSAARVESLRLRFSSAIWQEYVQNRSRLRAAAPRRWPT
jgi:ribosomal protein L22